MRWLRYGGAKCEMGFEENTNLNAKKKKKRQRGGEMAEIRGAKCEETASNIV